ncbi:hypothetical protein L1987_23918 [Smallanthus sonchifolius]|uniref:Uncharacterized protein n=1 Tax=Smallanthus sonchifolius TaxID=185202 RepID=A0ACB9IKA7_9ASTR|nr:hypothetical protein L1987_23918 [Smallanthus sonchifolius]
MSGDDVSPRVDTTPPPRNIQPASSQTSREEAGRDSPVTDGPSVKLLPNNSSFQTLSPFKIASASPRTNTLQPMERIDVMPEGVQKNFLRMRELMNSYVQEERAKGVKVRLAYEDEPEVTFSPIPPPSGIHAIHEEAAVTSSLSQNRTPPATGEDLFQHHMAPMTSGPATPAVRPLMQETLTATRAEANEIFQPYRSTSLTCFSEKIANFDFPTKIKMPANIKTYDGTND